MVREKGGLIVFIAIIICIHSRKIIIMPWILGRGRGAEHAQIYDSMPLCRVLTHCRSVSTSQKLIFCYISASWYVI